MIVNCALLISSYQIHKATDSGTEPICVDVLKYKGSIVHTYRTNFDHLLGKKYKSMEYDDLWMGITLHFLMTRSDNLLRRGN